MALISNKAVNHNAKATSEYKAYQTVINNQPLAPDTLGFISGEDNAQTVNKIATYICDDLFTQGLDLHGVLSL